MIVQTEQGVLVPGVTTDELLVALDLAMAMWRTSPDYLGSGDAEALRKVHAAMQPDEDNGDHDEP